MICGYKRDLRLLNKNILISFLVNIKYYKNIDVKINMRRS